MKKFIILICTSFLLIYCNKKEDLSLDNFITKYSNIDISNNIHKENYYYLFFVKTRDGRIVIIQNNQLYNIYTNIYKKKCGSYHEFLKKSFNDNFHINVEDITKYYKNDITIFHKDNLIANKSLNEIMFKYKLEANKYNVITIRDKSNKELYNNLLLKFFKNKYFIFLDDISGYSRLIKLEDLDNETIEGNGTD